MTRPYDVSVVGSIWPNAAWRATRRFRKFPEGENFWTAFVAPTVSFIAFADAIVLAILNFSFLAGGEGFVAWLWVLVPLAALLGLVAQAFQRNRELSFDEIV